MKPLFAAALAAVLVLPACTRPLTGNETRMARDVFGPAIDTDAVRVAKGLGLAPPPRAQPVRTQTRRAGSGFCDREPTPPRRGPPPGFAIGNTVFLWGDIYQSDAGRHWPDALAVPESFVFLHELVHVWQWQNRAATGYSPLAAFAEGLPGRDAYFYTPGDAPRLDDFGYEQQAAIVEDYICHAYFDPTAPRRAALRTLVAPVLAVDRLDVLIEEARR